MLEFLSECGKYNLSQKANDVEINLRAYNCIAPMQSFFEVVFKIILQELGSNLSLSQIDKITYSQIIKDVDVREFCDYKLNFKLDEYKLDGYFAGNKGKHSLFYTGENKMKVKEYFKYIYEFSCAYYKYNTKKNAPIWNDDNFEKLYNSCTSPNERIEKEKEYKVLLEQAEKDKATNKEIIKNKDGHILRLQSIIDNLKEQNSNIKENINKIEELEIDKKNLLDEKILAEQKLKEANNNISFLEKKLYLSNNKYEALLVEREQDQRKIRDYSNRIEKIRFDNSPVCKCGTKLVVKEKNGSYFWSCPNWRPNGQGCTEKTKTLTENEKIKFLQQKEQEKSINLEIEKLQSKKYIQSNKTKKDNLVVYDYYPVIKNNKIIKMHMFDSLLVDKEIFNCGINDKLSFFSRFYLSTNLEQNEIASSERTLYSIALRMLNRGTLLSNDSNSSNILKEKFNLKGNGDLKILNQYVSFNEPYMPYKTQKEKEFAEYYFPKFLDESWASKVLVGTNITMISSNINKDIYKNILEERIPFYTVNNGRKIVICIGKEISVELLNYLKSNDIAVLFINEDEIKDAKKVEAKLNILIKSKFFYQVDFDNKYLVATKLYHQLQISIIKALEQGYISSSSNIGIKGQNSIFTSEELEFILQMALEKNREIILRLSEIYNLDIKLKFDDSTKETITIHIGDGKLDSHSILIRDCYVDYHFLCNLEPFDSKIQPKNITQENIEYFLKLIFGYDHLREGQFEAIERLLLKKDSIILLPTGAGKSIIYQLSSFLVPGIIIVVSPLVSLIEDQVNNLYIKHGISTSIPLFYARTTKQKEEMSKNLSVLKHNTTSMIYLSPERLQVPSFRNSIQTLKETNTIYSVAIDEAHCVSEWGHDFRAAYLNVANVSRNILSKNNVSPTIIALTGTASDAVLNDVKRDLGILDDDAIITPPSFDRVELKYSIYNCDSVNKVQLISHLLKNKINKKFDVDYETFFKRNVGLKTNSGIVFTPYAKGKNQYSALRVKQELSDRLPELGINCYFSTIPDNYDELTWNNTIAEAANMFKSNKLNLLVATKAFGMGIDKENIRFTIHDGIPSSLEQFYQEAGRAGRDRKHSECILVFSNVNEEFNEMILNPALSLEQVQRIYEKTKSRDFVNDDLSTILFFHTGAYQGIDTEMRYVNLLISEFEKASFEEEHIINININQYIEDKSEEKKWLGAIIRFVILGVIKDYTYDYNGTFNIICGSYKKESIVEKYANYISVYNYGRIASEKNKIIDIDSSEWDLVGKSCKVLIEYIYENIEQSRRRSIKTMFDMAKEASKKKQNEQDAFIRNEILNYFSVKESEKQFIDSILDNLYSGFEIINGYVNLFTKKISVTKKQSKDVGKYKGAIVRQLESLPDHPGLLYFLAINELIGYKGKESENVSIANNVIAGYKYSISRYSIDKNMADGMLCGLCNFMLQKSWDIFEVFLKQLKDNDIDQQEVLGSLINKKYICSKDSDYLLLSYINSKISLL